jgi:hypothetical protein
MLVTHTYSMTLSVSECLCYFMDILNQCSVDKLFDINTSFKHSYNMNIMPTMEFLQL